MVKKLKKFFKKINISRTTILAIFFVVLSGVLIHRLYYLQIIEGEDYRENFSIRTTKERTLKSTRGNIYDRNGNLLAYNELSYALSLEDSGSYDSNRQKSLSLNAEAYKIIKILEKNGDHLSQDFHIIIDENNEYVFDVSGVSLMRFKADVFGEAYIDDLEPAEAEASAEEMMEYLVSEEKFAIIRKEKPYTDEELEKYGLPKDLSKDELLRMVTIRYALALTSYQKYLGATIATDLSQESVAAINENKDVLEGVQIVEDTKRVYVDSLYFSSIIGYTGKASAEELAELQSQKTGYTSTSIIGKAGIEKVMETTLQGSDGKETVYVDNLGKVLKIDENSIIEPLPGNDVYLTIDKELQVATYKILEQRLAGILVSVIINTKTFDKTELADSSHIMIPIYDVYNAMIHNGVIDTAHFTQDDASSSEKALQSAYEQKQREVFDVIEQELTGETPTPYKDLSKEFQEYMSYIVNDVLMTSTGILDRSAIDGNDPVYLAWAKEEVISLKEFLTYAASQNWIDISMISDEDSYLDSTQVYNALADYIKGYLSDSLTFTKLLYKYMLLGDRISGKQICHVLYDQEILDKEDGEYEAFAAGQIGSYELMISKISKLEITPAQLALEPCSGSAVVTNPNTGEVLACVTYPGYDNNRLANDMDVSYYRKIYNDLSRPLYNKATQQTTAPGSTFKLVTTAAGLDEKVITSDSAFECDGVFDLTETPLSCWNSDGHGYLTVVNGIQESCNVFFCNVAYQLGIDEEGNFRDSLALQKLQNYAALFDLDKPSGIEISEVSPQVSDSFGIQTSIGQGTNLFTTTQLARYVSTLANRGTSYNISLLDRITDPSGNLIEDFTPEIQSQLTLSNDIWDSIQNGMRSVITNKPEFSQLDVKVSGKTGTAQESKTNPDHALFIAYAPSEQPKISLAVRIANGYSSTNAMLVGKDIIMYHFNLAEESEILTGKASMDGVTSVQTD